MKVTVTAKDGLRGIKLAASQSAITPMLGALILNKGIQATANSLSILLREGTQ